MHRGLKTVLITLCSLIAILMVALTATISIVLRPQNSTALLKKLVQSSLSCTFDAEQIEISLFSTFPQLKVDIKNITLLQSAPGSPSDTLLHAQSIEGNVDLMKWWKSNKIVSNHCLIKNGTINLYTPQSGKSNFDILISDPSNQQSDPSQSDSLESIYLNGIRLQQVSIVYKNDQSRIYTKAAHLDSQAQLSISGNTIKGKIGITTPLFYFAYNNEEYLRQAKLNSTLTFSLIDHDPSFVFSPLKIEQGRLRVDVNGSLGYAATQEELATDLQITTNDWDIEQTLLLLPPSIRPKLKDLSRLSGELALKGDVKGILSKKQTPYVSGNLTVKNGQLAMQQFKLPIHNIQGDISFRSDLKSDAQSSLLIRSLRASTPQSTIHVTGTVDHLLSDIHCQLKIGAMLDLPEMLSLAPPMENINAEGRAQGTIETHFKLSQLKEEKMETIPIKGTFKLSDFYTSIDTLSVRSQSAIISFNLTDSLSSTLETPHLQIAGGKSYQGEGKDANIHFRTIHPLAKERNFPMMFNFSFKDLFAEMNFGNIRIHDPNGRIGMKINPNDSTQTKIRLLYNSPQMAINLKSGEQLTTDSVHVDTRITKSTNEQNQLLQWLPKGGLALRNGTITLPQTKDKIEIPTIQLDFTPEKYIVKDSRFRFNHSDFRLYGELMNLKDYLKYDSLLVGDFRFVSDTTDINSLLSLFNGIGDEETSQASTGNSSPASTPFMVPKGVSLKLGTEIQNAYFSNDTIQHLQGNVLINDGNMILDNMKFTTSAANMYLTALYRTPRKNHLFAGIDYHMTHVEIDKLLKMIPDIDSIMPMLRSFKGTGEFHMAVETYMDSLYNLKKSTLRGSAALTGEDLVVMDGETFGAIAKRLYFSKKTENKIDSLAAEFTIFKNEIDVYPFLIVMDKYKAIVGGRHNLDMKFDYNISVIDSPLPIRFGLNISGTPENMKFGLGKCKYSSLYRPVSRKELKTSQLQLKELIRKTLTSKMKSYKEGD